MKEYRDYYFKKAKAENYPARSVYKLRELDERFKLLRPGRKVLDLGASPGSWTLGISEKIGAGGLALACDLKPLEITLPPQAKFLQCDVFEPSGEFLAALESYGPFDLVASDMAPATTGNSVTDQARSLHLAAEAFTLAKSCLRKKGNFIVKIFMGPDSGDLLKAMSEVFESAKQFKPKSSRPESRETFFVGLSFRADKV